VLTSANFEPRLFFSLAITLRQPEFDINSRDPTQSQPRLTVYTLDLRIDYGLVMAIVHALAAASSESDVYAQHTRSE
jgi:hypothetical protein